MKILLDIAGAGVIGGTLVLGAAFAVPLVQRASAMSETIDVSAPRIQFSNAVGVIRDIPAEQRDVRMVGPRFYPNPANKLDLRGEG